MDKIEANITDQTERTRIQKVSHCAFFFLLFKPKGYTEKWIAVLNLLYVHCYVLNMGKIRTLFKRDITRKPFFKIESKNSHPENFCSDFRQIFKHLQAKMLDRGLKFHVSLNPILITLRWYNSYLVSPRERGNFGGKLLHKKTKNKTFNRGSGFFFSCSCIKYVDRCTQPVLHNCNRMLYASLHGYHTRLHFAH